MPNARWPSKRPETLPNKQNVMRYLRLNRRRLAMPVTRHGRPPRSNGGGATSPNFSRKRRSALMFVGGTAVKIVFGLQHLIGRKILVLRHLQRCAKLFDIVVRSADGAHLASFKQLVISAERLLIGCLRVGPV